MRKVRIMVFATALLVFACERVEKKEPKVVENRGNILAIPEKPIEKGALPAELRLETLDLESFLGKFKYRQKPNSYTIGTDFEGKVDPLLYHFQRVEVELPDTTTEIRMQNFGAWAIWKNRELNWEMITSMITDKGVMMHFHTLSPKLRTLNSFEIARRIKVDGTETYKRGKFVNDETYQ